MRVVTWNMGCAGAPYRKLHEQAWHYLLDDLQPDLALVQEASVAVPSFVRERGCLSLAPAWATRDWGTGVFSRVRETMTVALPECEGVHLVACEVGAPVGPLLAVSVHVSPSDGQRARLRFVVDSLIRAFGQQRVVLGGDFNAARHWDEVHKVNDYGWFFEELAKSNLEEAHWALHHEERQTFWGPQAKEGYQDDHFFVSRDWWSAALARSCQVVDYERVRALSDHAPVVLDL